LKLSGQLHSPAALTLGKKASDTHWTGGYVDTRVSLDDVEKRNFLIIPGLELQPVGRPARYPVAVPTALSRLLVHSRYNSNIKHGINDKLYTWKLHFSVLVVY
jgi:hypothetical protein